MSSEGFTLIELLVVLLVITALVAVMVPMGVHAIDEAKTTTVALDLSELSKAVMQEFYLSKKVYITRSDLEGYFDAGNGNFDNYGVKTTDNGSSTTVYIWYKNPGITADEAKKVLPSVVATANGAPMVEIKLSKYW